MMRRARPGGLMIGGALIALGTASLALAAPEDLLPPGFGSTPPAPAPAPAPVPASSPRPNAPTPSPGMPATPRPVAPSPGQVSGSAPVVQPLPDEGTARGSAIDGSGLPSNFPSLEEIEAMEEDEINALLGLKPKFDIPPAARRAMRQVGVLARSEGGFAVNSVSGQSARLIRAALEASEGPVISRWGHIVMRRALASRMDAPVGMSAVEFATLRTRALIAMGEGAVARALVQDVDGNNYDLALTDAAMSAYLATADILGMCPVARLQPTIRDDGEWEMVQALCAANTGEARGAERQLQRALGTGLAEEIDVRLAQRFAGAAAEGRRAVNIEWDDVSQLTPWRHALARALGEPIPDTLTLTRRYTLADAGIPAVPLLRRVEAGMLAGERGVLSSQAMIGLHSQLFASDNASSQDRQMAARLREAYVASSPAARLAAMQALWSAQDAGSYGYLVLTAYAAARFPVGEAAGEDAANLIASMLAAGLDRNALRWASSVEQGSKAWALLALANPAGGAVDEGAVDSFIDDASAAKSAFLVAGLAGLGRMDAGDLEQFSDRLDLDLTRASPWSNKISRAGQLRNQGLVALLAGLGMQGTSWERMTPRHLYFITRALNDAGLSAEARMIAAEAVARG